MAINTFNVELIITPGPLYFQYGNTVNSLQIGTSIVIIIIIIILLLLL